MAGCFDLVTGSLFYVWRETDAATSCRSL